MRPLYATPPAPQASPVPDGMVMVPREIIDRFPEINPSNYDHDDACALNAWGVEVVLAASPAAPVVRKLARMPAHEWEGDYPSADSYKEGYAEGWNDCLDAIDGITGASK